MQQHGMTLLEISVAGALLGVGTLAVFTLFFQLQRGPVNLLARYQELEQAQLNMPAPELPVRSAPQPCEIATRP